MINLIKTVIFFHASLVLAAPVKPSSIKRQPDSIIGTNYTCAKLVSMFFPNPYYKNYPLQTFSFDEAITAFNKNLDNRAADLKIGSQPFMRLQNPKKKAPTVVLLHGYSDSPGSMREIAEMYYQNGFNVISPLYRDHGLKPELQEAALNNSSLDHWREDVDLALSIAKALSPDGKVHIGGYSMGASLAVDLHLRHPELVTSMSLYAPLFREAGVVIQAGIHFLNWVTSGSFFKKIDETDTFYQRMTYRQTLEMHRLTRQIQPWLLKDEPTVPIAIFRTDREAETTVDDKFIDAVVERKNVSSHYIHDNIDSKGESVTAPVLHRDLPNTTINSTGEANPALFMMQQVLNDFLAKYKESP